MQLGYVLLLVGFLGGAYATVLDVQSTRWELFVPAAVLAVAGLLIVKRGSRGAARAAHVLTANRAELEASLARITAGLEEIAGRREQLDVDALRSEIDAAVRDDLRRFAAARESMVHLFGMQAYADIMSDFAAGERNVNRVWSASTDGYGVEAGQYLERALGRFRRAKARLEQVVRAA